MSNVPKIAAEIGRQMAQLARVLANASADGPPVATAALQPPFGNLVLSDWVRAVQLWTEHGTTLIAGQPRRACPACESFEHRFLFYSFDQYPYVDCLACGTWYVPHVVDDAFFEAYYRKCPEAAEIVQRFTDQRGGGERAEADRSRVSGYFSELEPLVDVHLRTYLDVGCGVGHALEVAAERGWKASGLDTSPSMLEAGRTRGLRIFHPSEIRPDETFGLVSLWETLEHINHPFDVLSGIASALHEDGLLSITVPNVLALEANVMRQDAAWINGGPGFGTVHINLFRPSSIERLLARVGLQVVGLDGEYGSNANEIVSYVLGQHRGAWDYARGAKVEPRLSEDTACLLNWIGPAWSALARQLLLAPAMKVIASKSSSAEHLAALKTQYAAARRAEILATLNASYPEDSR